MSISGTHLRIPRKRTRDGEVALQVMDVETDEAHKENVASGSSSFKHFRSFPKEEENEEERDCDACDHDDDDVQMEAAEKEESRPKSTESAQSESSERRKLKPKRVAPRRRCYSDSITKKRSVSGGADQHYGSGGADLIQSEDDLLYAPELLLNESALEEGHQIPILDVDDLDNILADLETLNL